MGYSKIEDGEGGSVRWDDFRAFVAIANASSIKRAANELGTTQSALSKRLARLESSLGVRLVDRGPLGASLTYQGERVFTRVLAAQKELARATSDAQVAESRVEGDCSILAGDGIANYWLSRFLAPFFNRFPHIELKIVLDHAIGASRNQVFDIRLHYYEPVDPSRVMKPIATVHFVPFASRAYLDRHGTPRSLGDLVYHRFLDQAQHLVDRGAWAAWFDDEQLKRTCVFTNQSAFLARCVTEGVGIALMPTYLVLNDKSLVPLDLGVTFPAKLYASYHRDRVTLQPVKATLAYLREVVFDPRNMPWFEEEFRFPEEGWDKAYEAAIARASNEQR